MRDRYPWLMTDERMGNRLWAALRALPPGSGVVFRHHGTPAAERRRLHARVRRIALARRLVLVVAGSVPLAGDGIHGARVGRGLRTWPAHDRREAIAGVRAGADLLFVSPVHATRSHPGARAIGPMRAARIGAGLGIPVIALGGMDAQRWGRIAALGFQGWAAIDALHPRPDQKRKAVPR
ncbi:thiamine phosphate synthase [Sphingomonas sp. CROZ-RG-20F-R02-07]|uniref:thiamine phosphate synthase n=1 Tax=Sphingomonas sp. CROZ-RG-20F-R02-07 TaxID=2914832 RepID=UPI003221DA99